jgi:sugar phosphate isomerase/epimerase
VEQSTQRAPDEREGSDSVPHLVHSFPLVEAKLHPPAPRPGTIPRERLVRLLMAEPRPSVVSIIAPPGYGKTVLLAEWAAREERPVAWLTLDDLDNDPSVFLSYVAAAVDRIEPIDGAIASALATPGPRILATAVPHLAHALHAIGRPAILVLDDVHRLVDRTCLDALAALLDHLPPGFQVAIAARTEPDLPFARFRAERDLLEIRRSELALDQGETEALTAAAGHPLTSLDARVLTERTEGWAVGVYLATLATLSGGAGGAGAVERVSGRDPYIAEYLRSELWPGLDDDDVALLTRTSILEVVEPRVAEAVSGLPGAAERLRSLARANQFITQVAGAGVSSRYHHLFRDFLQAELARREPAAAPELHRRAASWYAAAGSMDRAVEHAIRSGDIDAAAALGMSQLLTYEGRRPADRDREEIFGWVLDETVHLFEEALRYARTKGVSLSVEVHPFTLGIDLDWLVALCDRLDVPDFGVVYDCCHFAVGLPSGYVDAIRRLGRRIHHVHFSDSDRASSELHYAPGTGCLDLPGIVAALKETGFRGSVMLDLWLYPLPEEGSRIGVPYVANVLRELGLEQN